MPLRLRYVAIRFGIRPTARNAKRFERFALLDLDATRSRDTQWFDAFSEYTRARATVPHVKRTMRQLLTAGTKQIHDEELRQISVPVDLFWGQDDRMVPCALAEGASNRLGWPLHIIPGAAHAPHVEQPDAFVQAMTDLDPIENLVGATSLSIKTVPAKYTKTGERHDHEQLGTHRN